MDAINYLAGHSTVSFKNYAIEHSGKGMKPRQISAKCDRVMTYNPVTLGVTTSYDQPRPQNSRWSLVVLWRLLTIVRWSWAVLGGLGVFWGPLYDHFVMARHAPNTSPRPVGRREVFSSLLSVGEGCTMFFSGLCKVFVVFSSRRPLIDGDSIGDQTATNCRPPQMPPNYFFLSATSQQTVTNQLKTTFNWAATCWD